MRSPAEGLLGANLSMLWLRSSLLPVILLFLMNSSVEVSGLRDRTDIKIDPFEFQCNHSNLSLTLMYIQCVYLPYMLILWLFFTSHKALADYLFQSGFEDTLNAFKKDANMVGNVHRLQCNVPL